VQLVHRHLTGFGATGSLATLQQPAEYAVLAVINQVSSLNNARNRNQPNVKKRGEFKNGADF
jgi:hypothetical protein